jgi:hypothetical protein
VYHSAAKLGDPEKTFTAAAQFACDVESANMVLDFAKRAPQDRRIEAMGFRELEGKSGTIYLFGNQKIPSGWM